QHLASLQLSRPQSSPISLSSAIPTTPNGSPLSSPAPPPPPSPLTTYFGRTTSGWIACSSGMTANQDLGTCRSDRVCILHPRIERHPPRKLEDRAKSAKDRVVPRLSDDLSSAPSIVGPN